ncbi:MAG: hypothetical protein ACI8SA_000852, partial [Dokdonia sp.]
CWDGIPIKKPLHTCSGLLLFQVDFVFRLLAL